MSIAEQLALRGIQEVQHFTTSNGLVGILSTGRLLAHSLLPADKQLSHILQINCRDRSRDKDWHDYINLSISRVNGTFFSISQRWHATEDIFWCILGFSADIMTHGDVLFVTTNNAYEMAQRAPNVEGLKALFAPSIRQFPTKWATRSKAHPPNYTTCFQAEVLYPKELPLQYLRRIYVRTEAEYDEASAQVGLLNPQLPADFQIVVAPELFDI
jgi:hypothetical protein